MIAYKYRLYPNKGQASKLWGHANKLNWLYNYFLDQRIVAHKDRGETITHKQQQAELVELKKKDAALDEIHSQVVQQVPLRLDKAYQSFFSKNGGFPNFRSCRNFFGICYPQKGYSVERESFITKVYGRIRFNRHRAVRGNIKQVYITCDSANRWFLCVTTDYEVPKVQTNTSVGIDVGITNIVATSDGQIYPNTPHAKYFDKRINDLRSRRDLTCKKGSRRFGFLSSTIRRLYDAKERKIRDFQHKLSHSLSQQYDMIFVEDLDLKRMSEGEITGLNRELRNSQIAKFLSYLQYKVWSLVKVDPRDTTKMCNKCGKIHSMPLHKRNMECECGNREDRDVNAAKNIYCLGRAILERGCTVSLQEALAFRQG